MNAIHARSQLRYWPTLMEGLTFNISRSVNYRRAPIRSVAQANANLFCRPYMRATIQGFIVAIAVVICAGWSHSARGLGATRLQSGEEQLIRDARRRSNE